MRLFSELVKGTFIARPNRFSLLCDREGERISAFLPNPGRLQELLLPEAVLYLERAGDPERKMPYTAVAVEREGRPVMLHTHKTNDAAGLLIERGLVPGLEGAEIVRREVKAGRSRFDFLLRRGGRDLLLEVKSCTLFSRSVAMFPDAVTSRGRRHVEELASLSGKGTDGAVLFMVQWPEARTFLPEYHTDPAFAAALYRARKKIAVIPVAIGWTKKLNLSRKVRRLPIPWEVVEREGRDGGSYLLILELRRRRRVGVGRLGEVTFGKGFYIYVGSARKNLRKRIERHRRLRKRLFWHVDFLRKEALFHAALPIQTGDDLECDLARDLAGFAEWSIPRFGSSDCACESHLFAMREDPLRSPRFHEFLQYWRMERLAESG